MQFVLGACVIWCGCPPAAVGVCLGCRATAGVYQVWCVSGACVIWCGCPPVAVGVYVECSVAAGVIHIWRAPGGCLLWDEYVAKQGWVLPLGC